MYRYFKTRQIVLAWYENEDRKRIIDWLIDRVGEEYIAFTDRMAINDAKNDTEVEYPKMIAISCSDDTFNEIKFQLDLQEAWA